MGRLDVISSLRSSLARLLLKKFPELPQQALARVESIESPEELALLTERLLDATSPQDLGLLD